MVSLKAGYSYMQVEIPHVTFAFIEHFEKDLYQLYAGAEYEDFSLMGEVIAKTDEELTLKMHPFITLAQEKLRQ